MILGQDSFKDMFIFETNDLTHQLEEIVMENESAGNFGQESVNAVFRIMHTIKGSASMMGFQTISSLAHAMEDLFEYIRTDNQLAQNSGVVDMILESIDFIRNEVDKISEGKPMDGDPAALAEKARNMLATLQGSTAEAEVVPDGTQSHQEQTEKEDPAAVQQDPVLSDENKDKSDDFAPHMRYKATIFYEKDSGMEFLRAFMLFKDMEEFASDISYVPEDISDERCEEEIREQGFQVYFNANKSYEALMAFFNDVPFMEKVNLLDRGVQTADETTPAAPVVSEQAQAWMDGTETQAEVSVIHDAQTEVPAAFDPQALHKEPADSESAEVTHTRSARNAMISVSVDKLDELMDLVGELVISGMMVSGELLSDVGDEVIQNRRESLCHQHEKTISDLQDIAMILRMVPVSVLFHKMRRVVRDMCRKLEKDINMQVIGEETEIDKNVLDGISDPLLHLVRNAVDHGIGSLADRLAAGKPRRGSIVLEARNVGSDVWIFVKDDGQGLDRMKIYEKAYANGLIIKPENEMTDAEIFSYIFRPGFSTNESVTEFSGRGVGLDVVNQKVSQIGGSVLVESTVGQGSVFIIKIPTTLAIIAGMVFKVGDNKYSLPISAIRECVEMTEDDLMLDPDGNEAVIIREECYPILRLHRRYHIDTEVTSISDGILIVIEMEYIRYCLFVDELIGEQQVVVKSLPKWIDQKIKGVSGCTLLGDGSISLILEAASLIE